MFVKVLKHERSEHSLLSVFYFKIIIPMKYLLFVQIRNNK